MATPKLSVKQVKAALVKNKGLVYLAAKTLQVSPQTVYNYRDRHPEIRELIESLRGQLVDLAERKMIAAINKGEWNAIQFCLRTLGKARGYVERTEIRQVGEMTDEELIAIASGGRPGAAPPAGDSAPATQPATDAAL